MPHLMPSPANCGARMFAEFPLNRTWTQIREQVLRLRGASITTFFSNDEETWLLFNYEGFQFCLHDHDAKLEFSVDKYDCPDATLNRVLQHFSAILSLHLGD